MADFKLIIKTGIPSEADTVHSIEKFPFLIGRKSTCDLTLDQILIDYEHAVLEKDTHLTVQDLSTVSGTFVNGEKIEADKPVALKPKDVIQIGTFRIQINGDY